MIFPRCIFPDSLFIDFHFGPDISPEDTKVNMPASKVTKTNKTVHAALSIPGCPDTPPDSPTAQLSNPFEFARQVIDTVKLIQTSNPKQTSPLALLRLGPHAQD